MSRQDIEKINWQEFWLFQESVRSILQVTDEQKLKPVIVIGDTGAGKSTTINLLMGVKMTINDQGRLIPRVGERTFAEIGQGSNSCTLYPQVISGAPHDLAYCDCPGFLDTREDKASAVASAVPLILQHTNIQGFIIVADSAMIGFQKGQAFRAFADRLRGLLPLRDKGLRDKIIFVWTKGRAGDLAFQRDLREDKRGTVLASLINERNSFLIKPDELKLQPLQEALRSLAQVPSIPRGSLVLPAAPTRETSDFFQLAIRIQGAPGEDIAAGITEAKLTTHVRSLQTALFDITMAFHQISVKAIHRHNLELLRGDAIKLVLTEFFAYYSTLSYQAAADLPKQSLQKLLGFFKELRNLFNLHFSEAESQVEFFDQLIKAWNNFITHLKAHLEVDQVLVDRHLPEAKTIALDKRLTKLRHLQRDLLYKSCYQDFNGQNIPSTENIMLRDKLTEFATASSDKLNEWMGWLLRFYDSTEAKGVINPLLFCQIVREIVVTEQNFTFNTDPHNRIVKQAIKLVRQNTRLLTRMTEDNGFFTKLIDTYYTALQEVLNKQNAYLQAYQQTEKNTLDGRYASGNNPSPSLNLLGRPDDLIQTFNGKTINKLGEIKSGYVADRYGTPAAARALHLTLSPLLEWLKSIPSASHLLCAEYLGLISFTHAAQNNEVYHPEIPYGRHEGHATWVMSTVSPDWNKGANCVTGPHGAAFFGGLGLSEVWQLGFTLVSNLGPVFNMSFDGKYKTISVQAAFWRQGDAYYADPGGDGGFHYRLTHRLAPFVSEQWNARAVTPSFGHLLITLPDIAAYFIRHRQTMGTALTSQISSAHQTLLDEYKAALLKLDIAVLQLQVAAYLRGKDPNHVVFKKLINSTKIIDEIRTHKETLGETNLSPCLSSALSPRDLDEKTVRGLPDAISFIHPQNLLLVAQNLLSAYRAWRMSQFASASLRIVIPEKRNGYNRLIRLTGSIEEVKSVPSDAILLQKSGDRVTAYWDQDGKMAHKDLEIKEDDYEITDFLEDEDPVAKSEITRDDRQAKLIDRVTVLCDLELPVISVIEALKLLPPDAKTLTIAHRVIKDDDICFELGIQLRDHPALSSLTLKGVGLDQAKLEILMRPLCQLKLTELDLSHNPACRDRTGPADDVLELLKSQPRLRRLNLSYTGFSSVTLSGLASLLAQNSPLQSLNLLEIQLCDDVAALDLLAALYINTQLTELQINGASVSIIIADAIDFIMAHKRAHATDIPQQQAARIDYFDNILNEFLATREAPITVLDTEREVFPCTRSDGRKLFSLKGRAQRYPEVGAETLLPERQEDSKSREETALEPPEELSATVPSADSHPSSRSSASATVLVQDDDSEVEDKERDEKKGPPHERHGDVAPVKSKPGSSSTSLSPPSQSSLPVNLSLPVKNTTISDEVFAKWLEYAMMLRDREDKVLLQVLAASLEEQKAKMRSDLHQAMLTMQSQQSEETTLQQVLRESLTVASEPKPRTLQLIAEAKTCGLVCHEIARQGNCLYEAFLDQLNERKIALGTYTNKIRNYHDLREVACKHIINDLVRTKQSEFQGFLADEANNYIIKLMADGTWGGELELRALSREFKIIVIVINSDGINSQGQTGPDIYAPPGASAGTSIITLGYERSVHYQSLRDDTLADEKLRETLFQRARAAEVDTLPLSNREIKPTLALQSDSAASHSSSSISSPLPAVKQEPLVGLLPQHPTLLEGKPETVLPSEPMAKFKEKLTSLCENNYAFTLKRSSTNQLLIRFTNEDEAWAEDPKEIEKELKAITKLLQQAVIAAGIKTKQFRVNPPDWKNWSLTITAEPTIMDRIARLLQEAGLKYFSSVAQAQAALFHKPAAVSLSPKSPSSLSTEASSTDEKSEVGCAMQ